MFFFSSRRRHTRWPRDWSSDVCSSDLLARPADNARAGVLADALDRATETLLHEGKSPQRKLGSIDNRSEEHTSELQSRGHLVCRLLLEKKKNKKTKNN